MKTTNWLYVFVLLTTNIFVFTFNCTGQELTAKEIIKKADDKRQGNSNEAVMSMTVVRPTWKRTYSFKSWAKGRDYSLALIVEPVKDKGQSFLKRKNEMWNWNPKIGRMIKLPPSMMSQGWMGSDYSNDDILKESSIVVDYNHKIVSSEKIAGYECYKIEMLPKADAAVVWGKLLKWISKDGFLQLKTEYYDEDNYLVKTENSSKVKKMDDREIPTCIEIIPADEPGNKTIVEVKSASFNIKIEDSFFSQQNMKRVR